MSFVVAASVLVVAAVLAVGGAMKLLTPAAVPAPGGGRWYERAPTGPWARGLGGLEILAAAGLLARWRPVEALVAALLWAFAGWMALAVARGRSGAPCPCFGGQSAISRGAALRNAALAAVATGVAIAPAPKLSGTEWLAVLVAVLTCSCALLGAIAFILAREVARLRARSGPAGALEVPGEGPALGVESPLIERFSSLGSETLAVAVFVSPGCRLCTRLAPAVQRLAAHPGAEVAVFDEERDPLAWATADVPGSPYAIAMSAGGVVLAKGTFNTPEQLETVPATAQRRLRERGLSHV